jgi:hypothetical protein
MQEWCIRTLPADTWKYVGGWPGTMFFKNEEDLTMFTLKWL